MSNEYKGVITRFLRQDERLIQSDEHEMPLVIEASDSKDAAFLQLFVTTYSTQLLQDIAHYGAVLLRGFAVFSEEDFEATILNIQGLQPISDAFMSEEGRVHTGDSKYVLHTNAVYKTGGTLYLGGFHSENYYSTDVPGYIFFSCLEPSRLGGETGLINMKKIYRKMDESLKKRLEAHSFFVSKWLVSDVTTRYNISTGRVEAICSQFNCSCLWKKGDILLIDNKQIMHAGMPGSGSRLIRAIISNPVEIDYSPTASGCLICNENTRETIGACM